MDPNMVDEMKFEAPLAKFDCEEWSQADEEDELSENSTQFYNNNNNNNHNNNINNSNEVNNVDNKAWLELCVNNNNLVSLENAINKIFHSQQDDLFRNRTSTTMACSIEKPCIQDINDNNHTEDIFGQNYSLGLDNFCETLSKSLEDLVNTFDERITKSLRNFDDKVQDFAPVQTSADYDHVITATIQDSAYFSDGGRSKWDFLKSRKENETSDLEDSSDDGGNYETRDDDNDDEDDDDDDDEDEDDDDDYDVEYEDDDVITEGKADDDFEAFSHEPLITADEVINELEEILESDYNQPSGYECINYDSTLKWITNNNEDTDLETMSIEHLHDYVDGLENNVHFLSEELIKELAFRDELNYEKETKNRFLCLLMTVQKKKKDAISDSSSSNNPPNRGAMKPYELAFKKLRNFSDRVIQKRSYLTTVIPYEASMGPPSLDTLCIYNQILYAMADDSPSALALLTDYILKVLCPKA